MLVAYFKAKVKKDMKLQLNTGTDTQARSQDLEKGGGGCFERVRSVQTTLTRIFIGLETVTHGLSEN